MGLFDFAKSKTPPEHYLAQYSGTALRKVASELGLYASGGGSSMDGVCYIMLKICTDELHKNHWLKNAPNAQRIPREFHISYYEIPTAKVLEMAMDKGDAEAPFYFAMFHMLGLALGTYDSNKNAAEYTPDNVKMEAYLKLARERGSKMEQAYAYIQKQLRKDLPQREHLDTLVHCMALSYKMAQPGQSMEQLSTILGDELAEFSRLGVIMMAACSNMGLCWSTISFAKMAAGFKGDRSGWSDFTKQVLLPTRGIDGFTDEHTMREHFSLLVRVIVQAQEGDEYAARILEEDHVDIKYALDCYAKLKRMM